MRPEIRKALIAEFRASQADLDRIMLMIKTDQPCNEILHELIALSTSMKASRKQLVRKEAMDGLASLNNDAVRKQQDEIISLLLDIYTF